MAITLAAPHTIDEQTEAPTVPAWIAVSEGLWSCNLSGEFLGSVEFTAGGFEAVDSNGTPLGRSHSLVGAKKLIEGLPPEQYSDVLRWRDDRRAFAIAWTALFVSAVASVTLALQFVG